MGIMKSYNLQNRVADTSSMIIMLLSLMDLEWSENLEWGKKYIKQMTLYVKTDIFSLRHIIPNAGLQ